MYLFFTWLRNFLKISTLIRLDTWSNLGFWTFHDMVSPILNCKTSLIIQFFNQSEWVFYFRSLRSSQLTLTWSFGIGETSREQLLFLIDNSFRYYWNFAWTLFLKLIFSNISGTVMKLLNLKTSFMFWVGVQPKTMMVLMWFTLSILLPILGLTKPLMEIAQFL